MVKIGVCGFGTVGQSFVEHILSYHEKISKNSGKDFVISIIADRSIDKKKFKSSNISFTSNIMDVIDSDCDLIVELVGGTEISYELVKAAILNKKSVITANKALIAEHGDELFRLSRENQIFIGYEAAVAGAIPIINSLGHNMLNEQILSLSGIINGTCNYILERMSSDKLSFEASLSDAQKLGYAESDPTFDIGGLDAAHKISILSMLAYGIESPFKKMHIEGIESISSMDISFAHELGYTIKHLALAQSRDDKIECQVYPALISKRNILSKIDGVMNAVKIKGDKFGTSLLYGHGAGGAATASAVVSNISDYFNHLQKGINLTLPMLSSKYKGIININDIYNQFYLRMFALDEAGVMAEITSILADYQISIEAVTQHEPIQNEKLIPIVMITNSVKYSDIKSAIKKIESLKNIDGTINSIRVLNDNE